MSATGCYWRTPAWVASTKKPPANMGETLHLDRFAIAHPLFGQAQNYTYTQAWPPHHALADARALMAGYRAWHQFMEKIWSIES